MDDEKVKSQIGANIAACRKRIGLTQAGLAEKLNYSDKAAAQNDPAVKQAVAEVAARLGDTGRILVRESGTEPVIRVMVEAPSKEICKENVDQVVSVIRASGYAV